MHTKEQLTVTYKRDGRYEPEALTRINHILRDWRRNETIRMDPELIDLVYDVHDQLGSHEPIHIVSGYRSPVTNSALRERSRGVAQHSQHMLGKAMDLYFPDVNLSKIREVALLHEGGGVGYYPTSGRPFVHIDTGRVRHWPRMPREQLARLFPDGNTDYIPADGRPLPRKVRTQDVMVASNRNGKESAQPRFAVASAAAPAPQLPNPSRDVILANSGGVKLSLFGNGKPAPARPSVVAALPPSPPPVPAQRPGDTQRQALPEPSAAASAPALASAAPLPALRPFTVASLAKPTPALAYLGGGPPPAPTAKLPSEVSPRGGLVLASLGPATAPPERAHTRDDDGIWSVKLSYQPPAVRPLVTRGRVHDLGFAMLVAPDQMHIDPLMKRPGMSLAISFTRGATGLPSADMFTGRAVQPLQIAEFSQPFQTAAR